MFNFSNLFSMGSSMMSNNDTERPKVKGVNSLTSKGLSENASMEMGEDIGPSVQNKLNGLNSNNKSKGSGGFMNNAGAIASGVGMISNAFGNDDDLIHEGQLESTTRAVNTINSTKDAVGKAIPIAGLFREVEKLGVKAGKAIDGDKGQAIAEGYFSPIQTVGKLNADDELSQGEKMWGSFATMAVPFGGTISGSMINKANQRRAKKMKEINKFKKETKEEIDYQNEQQLKALKKLRALKEAQLNYVPTARYS